MAKRRKKPQNRQPSRTRHHRKARKANWNGNPMPESSDVEVRDANTGELLRIERTKKPLNHN